MRDRGSPDRSRTGLPFSKDHRRRPQPIELWRLRGIDELRGVAIETSFGYAFGLELDTELILLHLQCNVESMVAYADRMESALLAQGWHPIEA
jgi:hypothetical protein